MTVQPTVGIIFAYVPPCYGNFVAYRSASLHDFTLARSYDVSHCYAMLVVGLSGLEPPTSRLSGVRSNQLSYEPIGLRRPSTLPGSCPPSTIDRLGLNRRVRNGNGCVPRAHHHRRCFVCFLFCLKV